MERVIMLVRHASTPWSGRFIGHRDVALSAVGRGEARLVARRIAALRPQAMISSDLARARATAVAIAAATGIGFAVDTRLREEDLGRWSGLDHLQVRERFPAEYARWRSGERWAASENREGLDAVADRAVAAIDEAEGDPLVVVTHTNTAYAIVRRLLGHAGPWADLPPAGHVVLTGGRR